MDADGCLFIAGRLKEIIIKSGENISPGKIGDALYRHADVVEAVIEAAAFAPLFHTSITLIILGKFLARIKNYAIYYA